MGKAATPISSQQIADWMAQQDRFANLLGIELESVAEGACRVSMRVTGDHTNAVGITHGGVTFSLADFAFAVASNSHGQVAVALSTTMSYPAASRAGDKLFADAKEIARGNTTATYEVKVTREDQTLVGAFTGTVYRRKEAVAEWINKTHEH